jgi:hypothetical protein
VLRQQAAQLCRQQEARRDLLHHRTNPPSLIRTVLETEEWQDKLKRLSEQKVKAHILFCQEASALADELGRNIVQAFGCSDFGGSACSEVGRLLGDGDVIAVLDGLEELLGFAEDAVSASGRDLAAPPTRASGPQNFGSVSGNLLIDTYPRSSFFLR